MKPMISYFKGTLGLDGANSDVKSISNFGILDETSQKYNSLRTKGQIKFPSAVAELNLVASQIHPIGIGKKKWCAGVSAMRVGGNISSPVLERNNKVKNIHVRVVNSIVESFVQSIENNDIENYDPNLPYIFVIDLDLLVSNPHATYDQVQNAPLLNDLKEDLKKLRDNVSYQNITFHIRINRLGVLPECGVFLLCYPQFKAVMDAGSVTLQAATRIEDLIQRVGLQQGQNGGCNRITRSLFDDGEFNNEIRKAGYASAMTFDKLNAVISGGKKNIGDIDLVVHLKRLIVPFLDRLNDSIIEVQNVYKFQSYEFDSEILNPELKREEIALIGGGAALVRLTGKEASLDGVHVYNDDPEFQTALCLEQLLRTNLETYTVEVNIYPKQKLLVDAETAA